MKHPDSPNSASTLNYRLERLARVWFASWAIGMLFLTAAFVQYIWFMPAVAGASTVSSLFAEDVFTQANQERLARGLPILNLDEQLNQAAQAKAQDMIARGYFGHYYQNNTPWQFIDRTGDTNWRFAGENLAKNYASAPGMIAAWIASPTHRANLLSDHFDRTGVATMTGRTPQGDQVTVTVQLFTGS